MEEKTYRYQNVTERLIGRVKPGEVGLFTELEHEKLQRSVAVQTGYLVYLDDEEDERSMPKPKMPNLLAKKEKDALKLIETETNVDVLRHWHESETKAPRPRGAVVNAIVSRAQKVAPQS